MARPWEGRATHAEDERVPVAVAIPTLLGAGTWTLRRYHSEGRLDPGVITRGIVAVVNPDL